MAFFPGDTATVRLDNMRLNKNTKVLAGAEIDFDVYDGDTIVASGIGTQEGSTNNWLLTFDIPLATVPPVELKVESVTVYNGATRTDVVLVPVGVV